MPTLNKRTQSEYKEKVFMPIGKNDYKGYNYLPVFDNSVLISTALAYLYEAIDLTEYYEWNNSEKHIVAKMFSEYHKNINKLKHYRIGDFFIDRRFLDVYDFKKTLIKENYDLLTPSELKKIIEVSFFSTRTFSITELFGGGLAFTCTDDVDRVDRKYIKAEVVCFSITKQVKKLSQGEGGWDPAKENY